MRTERQHIGEEDALRIAFDEHYLALLKLSVLVTGDQTEAEDLVQEASLRVAPKLGSVPFDELRPYLRTVALNLWRSRLRRLAVERRPWTKTPAPSPSPETPSFRRSSIPRIPTRTCSP